MSDEVASAAGSQPSSRSVWLVMGPIEIAATPAKGNAMPARRAASARWVTLEELVKAPRRFHFEALRAGVRARIRA